MPIPKEIQKAIYDYCGNHLAGEDWYSNEFSFIGDKKLRNRLVAEFKAIRFAYKLYEGIEAKGENLLFEVRCQILSYATIYEAVIQYVLYTHYSHTKEFEKLTHHTVPTKIDIPGSKKAILERELFHDGKNLHTFFYCKKEKDETNIRFDHKCNTASDLKLLNKFEDSDGKDVDLVKDIIEIYSYRNGIHIHAEQRKNIEYELDLRGYCLHSAILT